MRTFILLTLSILFLSGTGLAQGQSELTPQSALSTLPVQSGGRLKPLDTLARESVRLVTGKASFQKQDPVITLLTWWADPEATKQLDIIEFRNLELKKELGLAADQRWYSYQELVDNKPLDEYRQEIHEHLKNEEELHGNEQKIQDLLVKINLVHQAMDGTILQAVPHPEGLEQDWGSFADLDHAQTVELVQPAKKAVDELRAALKNRDQQKLSQAVVAARTELAKLGPVPEEKVMARELRYNESHPFRKAWILYLIGLAVLTFVKSEGQRTTGYWVGFSLIAAGFLMHIYGFALRCLIAGRPPVTNMYESVIWVAFGAVLFALIFEVISSKRYYLMAAAAGAVVCLVLADTLPTVLDPSIRPLTPVLRSNFWLTIHVLSITLGYAAFMLALGLGHIVLWKCALRPEQKEIIKSLHDALYRALQVGVLFLGAGTILGGVWANYSWGRFWGWDPKEVWALIAFLGYIAILHGRHAGWLRKFGIAAWSVIAFQGVLMAWYGVNYVLGAGLHSYGFGTGGSKYVAIYVAFELLFVLWATAKHRGHQQPTALEE
jgi:cytochrome c-type biogenesis protein CcsB